MPSSQTGIGGAAAVARAVSEPSTVVVTSTAGLAAAAEAVRRPTIGATAASATEVASRFAEVAAATVTPDTDHQVELATISTNARTDPCPADHYCRNTVSKLTPLLDTQRQCCADRLAPVNCRCLDGFGRLGGKPTDVPTRLNHLVVTVHLVVFNFSHSLRQKRQEKKETSTGAFCPHELEPSSAEQ